MKKEAFTHTKMGRLMRRLQLPRYAAAGLLEGVWLVTAAEATNGAIGKLTNEDIAIAIDWPHDPDLLIDALVASGWIDQHGDHRLVIHDWSDHAPDHVHTRLARSLSYFVDGTKPKFRGLNKDEMSKARRYYGDDGPGEGIDEPEKLVADRLETSQKLVGNRLATGQKLVADRSTKPNQTKPNQTKRTDGAPELFGNELTTADPPFVRSSPAGNLIQLPDKSMERRPPKAASVDFGMARVVEMRGVLHGYMSQGGKSRASPPDDGIVLRCLDAIGGATVGEAYEVLRRCYQAEQSPAHAAGPKKYAWFEAVLRSNFQQCAGAG